jgi:hypothetical protein
MLLSCVHHGYLWLDRLVSIDTYLFVHIVGLLSQEEDPSLLFFDKKNEKTLSERMKEKFHTFRGQRRLYVSSVCDPTVWFTMQAFDCKLLRKCRNNQVSVAVIVAMERCVEDV